MTHRNRLLNKPHEICFRQSPEQFKHISHTCTWIETKKGSYLPHILGIRPNVLFQNEELIPDPASLGAMMRVLVAVGQFGLVVGERGAGWRRGPIAPLEHT